MLKRIVTVLAVVMASALCLDVGAQFVGSGPVVFVSTAEAEVGRPLTPVSVAGVARRTARRCAAGVYNC